MYVTFHGVYVCVKYTINQEKWSCKFVFKSDLMCLLAFYITLYEITRTAMSQKAMIDVLVAN